MTGVQGSSDWSAEIQLLTLTMGVVVAAAAVMSWLPTVPRACKLLVGGGGGGGAGLLRQSVLLLHPHTSCRSKLLSHSVTVH